jgi:hypothetical protein
MFTTAQGWTILTGLGPVPQETMPMAAESEAIFLEN